jgi:HlyD family secretion protein
MARLLPKRWFAWMVGLAVLAGLVYAFLPRPVAADVARATRGPLRVTVDEEGKTRIRNRYVVAAPLAGRLLRVHLKAGNAVAAGDVLAVLEPTDPAFLDARAHAEVEARVKAAEKARERAATQLQRARAAETLCRSNFDRAKRMFAGRSLSEYDYEDFAAKHRTAQEDLKAAEFDVQIREFELEQARAALVRSRPRSPGGEENGRLEVRAPVSGRVLRVMQESETVVTPGLAVLEVGDPAELEIEIDVLSSDAVKIRTGAKAYLEHWGGEEPLVARVRYVEPAGFTKRSPLGVEEQRVWVIADFADPPEKRQTLGDAYRVEARIVVWEGADVLKVPAGALFRNGDGWAVFAVENGKARVRPVRVGHANGIESEILDGLAEGDSVIAHPGDKIKDGVAVAPR